MLCVATVRLEVVQAAVSELPLPVRATAEQPVIDEAPSLKLTEPVGALPVTVAVKVTLAPNIAGLAELDSVVADVALLTTCDNAVLVDAVLLASPP